MNQTAFLRRIGLRLPLIVAPMAGGPSSVELVSASSESGALGSMGAAYSSPFQIEEFVVGLRKKTSKPFAINLFINHPEPKVSSTQIECATEALAKFRNALGLKAPSLVPPYEEDFELQFETVLELKPAVFSFVFGALKPEHLRALKSRNIVAIGTATTIDEAKALEDLGVDAVTVQGIEAGGHRGMFDASAKDPEISLMSLLRESATQLKIPVIAAGGIMNSRDIKEALAQGAAAVQMGTAFLACKEAGTSAPYRAALLKSESRKTDTSRAYSGRLARGIENQFMIEMRNQADSILPFPAQNKFTRDIRARSAERGLSDFLSMWCGSGKGKLWQGSCAELIGTLF
ncbi:MAG: nitronate monooxygenase [Bdellovibrionota bacterium]